jgi:hypothetical protein
MGLDMYLYADKYVSEKTFMRTDNPDNPFVAVSNPRYAELITDFPEGADETAEYKSITLRMKIGDWRKVNQVHGWFISNCTQDGRDDNQEIYVDAGKLRELRVLCEFLLDNRTAPDILDKIEEHLPLTDGFFFGSREIDDYYWIGLENTIPILNNAIRLTEDEDCSIYYNASW